tara:strand:+ start:668 stop:1150 length:483 start_codon:yes stop_codon:yes gene_type:complete
MIKYLLILLLPTVVFASVPKEKEPDCKVWNYKVLQRHKTTQDEMPDNILKKELARRWEIYDKLTEKLLLMKNKKDTPEYQKLLNKCIDANVKWRDLDILKVSRAESEYAKVPLVPFEGRKKAFRELAGLKTFHHLMRSQFRNMASERIKYLIEIELKKEK